MNTKHIRIKDYNYDLPDKRIAKFPLPERDKSKLLVYNHGEVSQDVFSNITHYLPQGALMVFNNTKVIQARLHFRKETGSLIEIFLLEPALPADYEQMFQTTGACSWYCLVGNLKKWKGGPLTTTVEMPGQPSVQLSAERDMSCETALKIDFKWTGDDKLSFAELIDKVGELPIPPYLNRNTQESDKTTYQTVYSKIKGSVAAPTAGLHFTQKVLADIDQHGIDREELTLHVGAGTFKPVKSEEIEGHAMHTEYVCIRRSTLEKLLQHNCEAVAVGTTSVRTLESLYYMGCKVKANPNVSLDQLHVNQWEPYASTTTTITPAEAIGELIAYMDRNNLPSLHSSTQIIIAPGYQYKIVKRLITNFHQPQSTLLLLVSAFVGGDWKSIYRYALDNDFRFLSYGDSSILIP
ncbi:S-adenosylmethionine:tRNA ribosyltransferase-isomerase [Hoylesella loescheii]|uniref:Putative S-adenosylmethionine:tRNA ribosyltransferase-isomerase n=1 Tax=Hoylesella loescheii DSM 19665 = JCM 12249 = ATCC 15930 TaxID=1122985 RepID=A0A069QGG4_HOYLO|nr:S-adenosylmethionine:tRNA ribosyltransferase-isomerase [Hoylesella loescheii]KDR51885.1 putative S-adenosylmethionine:tRNA ribosyltransferase-isomerase [Hoylesella loescheii DSM 19665 = JCM 12249 = ATCC 15930]